MRSHPLAVRAAFFLAALALLLFGWALGTGRGAEAPSPPESALSSWSP